MSDGSLDVDWNSDQRAQKLVTKKSDDRERDVYGIESTSSNYTSSGEVDRNGHGQRSLEFKGSIAYDRSRKRKIRRRRCRDFLDSDHESMESARDEEKHFSAFPSTSNQLRRRTDEKHCSIFPSQKKVGKNRSMESLSKKGATHLGSEEESSVTKRRNASNTIGKQNRRQRFYLTTRSRLDGDTRLRKNMNDDSYEASSSDEDNHCGRIISSSKLNATCKHNGCEGIVINSVARHELQSFSNEEDSHDSSSSIFVSNKIERRIKSINQVGENHTSNKSMNSGRTQDDGDRLPSEDNCDNSLSSPSHHRQYGSRDCTQITGNRRHSEEYEDSSISSFASNKNEGNNTVGNTQRTFRDSTLRFPHYASVLEQTKQRDCENKEEDGTKPASRSLNNAGYPMTVSLLSREHDDSSYEPDEALSCQSSSETDDNDEDDQGDNILIGTIIARLTDTPKNWDVRCEVMNTSEVQNGSLWYDASAMNNKDTYELEERYLVKWAELSHIHCTWEKENDLLGQSSNAESQLRAFNRIQVDGFRYDASERCEGEFFDDRLLVVERILEIQHPNGNMQVILDKKHPDYAIGTGRQFLIKWGNSQYTNSTYEHERDLVMMNIHFETQVNLFMKYSKKPTPDAFRKNILKENRQMRQMKKNIKSKGDIQDYVKELRTKQFANGGQLRDYQAEGVAWLVGNHVNGKSMILADEMGLGKTIQTAAYLTILKESFGIRGPFLIIVPLSTVTQWQRALTTWTDINTILYTGTAADRAIIREYEFAFECDRPGRIRNNQNFLRHCHKMNTRGYQGKKLWMIEAVVTTPEIFGAKDKSELLHIDWETLIIDEAHSKLKQMGSKFAMAMRDEKFLYQRCLLLTGTPIQNSMKELWTMLNVVDPAVFGDRDQFLACYGNMQSKETVDELHEIIRPYMLRRLKGDVEKNLPPKEETIIEVELTNMQKKYYRALYERNHAMLRTFSGYRTVDNLAMELRKCCNHPFLLEGVEEAAAKGVHFDSTEDEADFLVKASGKLVLLDKLLPKLKKGGHRVLIFSQFKIMLNIIEDYLGLREYDHERIDGSITGKKRQMAIDRFQRSSSVFVMLLTTRAGGVGINLTAADTCIIFDSDWNPQNDLQAQARCHRIGQTKHVKVYRLLTRKTYEMRLFHCGSMKMGLDQAVMQGLERKREDMMSAEEAERLLRCGAYDFIITDSQERSDRDRFFEEDIETILLNRTKTCVRETNSTSGFAFNKACFQASDGKSSSASTNIDIDDPDFWGKFFAESEDNTDITESRKGDKEVKENRRKKNSEVAKTAVADSELLSSSDSSDCIQIVSNGYENASNMQQQSCITSPEPSRVEGHFTHHNSFADGTKKDFTVSDIARGPIVGITENTNSLDNGDKIERNTVNASEIKKRTTCSNAKEEDTVEDVDNPANDNIDDSLSDEEYHPESDNDHSPEKRGKRKKQSVDINADNEKRFELVAKLNPSSMVVRSTPRDSYVLEKSPPNQIIKDVIQLENPDNVLSLSRKLAPDASSMERGNTILRENESTSTTNLAKPHIMSTHVRVSPDPTLGNKFTKSLPLKTNDDAIPAMDKKKCDLIQIKSVEAPYRRRSNRLKSQPKHYPCCEKLSVPEKANERSTPLHSSTTNKKSPLLKKATKRKIPMPTPQKETIPHPDPTEDSKGHGDVVRSRNYHGTSSTLQDIGTATNHDNIHRIPNDARDGKDCYTPRRSKRFKRSKRVQRSSETMPWWMLGKSS